MDSILIANGTIITMDKLRRVIRDGAILIEDSDIAAVGKSSELKRKYSAEITIYANNNIVMPGLINTHTHLFQSLGKDLGTDVNLIDWFKKAWNPLVTGMNDKDYYNAAMLGILEAIETGTTTILAYEHALNAHPSATKALINAIEESKIRALIGYGYQDTGIEIGAPPIAIRETSEIVNDIKNLLEQYNHSRENLLRFWLAPGTINWCTQELIEKTKELASMFDTGITVHMNETKAEYEFSKKTRGYSEVEYAFKIGLLGPKTLAVHTVWVDDYEISLLAKTSTKVSHNPISNMYLASGVAPIPKMLKKGIIVGLGTDGPSSNNNHNMFDVIRVTPLLHKVITLDPGAITAEQTLEMATIMGAKALQIDDLVGSIEVGKKADIIILDIHRSNLTPSIYPPATIVYGNAGLNVDTVIINGEILMEHGEINHLDREKILENAKKSLNDILSRVDPDIERRWPLI
ncbi:MAG: amidohydrolase family protein [Candidatus Njordarchaeia archaeon]